MSTTLFALQKIHNFEQIMAIENDPNFKGGDYYGGPAPDEGLMLARMIGHKTFVSLGAMLERARREVVRRDEGPGTYAITDPMESYMWHQGTKFVERFDANSYLRIMEAWQRFDLAVDAGVDDIAVCAKTLQPGDLVRQAPRVIDTEISRRDSGIERAFYRCDLALALVAQTLLLRRVLCQPGVCFR